MSHKRNRDAAFPVCPGSRAYARVIFAALRAGTRATRPRFAHSLDNPYACLSVSVSPWVHPAPSFSGLGRRPFTAVARVRIPLGSLLPQTELNKHGPVAQLVSVPPCHGGGRGFKSRQGRSGATGPLFSEGLSSRMRQLRLPRGSVAQLVERTTENREVTGSTPVGATGTLVRLLRTGVSSFVLVRGRFLWIRLCWWRRARCRPLRPSEPLIRLLVREMCREPA